MFGDLINEETLSRFGEVGTIDQEGEEELGGMRILWKIGKS
jgi:hypothetical protein